MNVAIDGPAGAGKSTIAKLVAKKLGYLYVDTGAIYRTLALACIREKIAAEDVNGVTEICSHAKVELKYEDGEQNMYLNGEKVNEFIRTEEVSRVTSAISVYKAVRDELIDLQRKIAAEENVIMDGRDIGTFVLPSAEVKIYLTASAATRAKRRYLEQQEKGIACELAEIEEDIRQRDYRDMHREIAPLKQAEDALVIDSSDLTITEVAEEIIKQIKGKER